MSYSHKYDESGLVSSYLLLSLITPIAIYLTYLSLKKTTKARVMCSCSGCKRIPKKSRYLKNIAMVVCWAVIALMVKNTQTLKMEVSKGFNPLNVLGLEAESSQKELSKRFKKLNLKYRIKMKDAKYKKECEEKLAEISKAYNIVKNKKQFEKWLNFESKTDEIIAIPNIVMQKGGFAFFIYSLLLGIVLPKWAYGKWKVMKENNKVNVNFNTMETFYKKIHKDISGTNEEIIRYLINVLCASEELANHKWTSKMSGIKAKIENEYAYPLTEPRSNEKGYFVLYDHLFRLGYINSEDREYLHSVLLNLIEGMKAIAVAKRLPSLIENILVIRAMIIQAVPDIKYSLLQYPYIKFIDLFMSKKDPNPNEFIEANLSDGEKSAALWVLNNVPFFTISKFRASVINTGEEKENSIEPMDVMEDDLLTNTRLETLGKKKEKTTLFVVPKNSQVTVTAFIKKENVKLNGEKFVHAPYFSQNVDITYTAILSINGVLHEKPMVFEDFEDIKKIEFKVNTYDKPNIYQYDLIVICSEYLKCVESKRIPVKVE